VSARPRRWSWDDTEGFAQDTYPHDKLGRVITIYEFLTKG